MACFISLVIKNDLIAQCSTLIKNFQKVPIERINNLKTNNLTFFIRPDMSSTYVS